MGSFGNGSWVRDSELGGAGKEFRLAQGKRLP
jgi:hypothetical protein